MTGGAARSVQRRGVLAAPIALLARPGLAQAPAELRLGAIFPLSGPLALLGDESFRGVEMAVEERNAAGGVLGRPLRLIRADAPDEAAAAAEARRLTAGNDRVAALFGSYSTAVALPASQIAEAAGLPFFELGAFGDAVVERGFRGVFRASPRASDLAATAVGAVVELLAPALGLPLERLRLAIAHEAAPGGEAIGTAQESLARVRGIAVTERMAYAPRGADLNAVAQRLRAQEADVVLHCGGPGDELLLFRALREAGWAPRMLIGTVGGYAMGETARSLGAQLTGTMVVDSCAFEVNERHAPGARAFPDAYLRRYGAEPRSAHALAACAGTRLFLEAMHGAGGLERERIRAAVLALDLPEAATIAGWGARFEEKGQNLRATPVLAQWQAAGSGLRLLAIQPAGAALADPLTRLGG
jgi:branched-chain amino acid transport system substrate-binding protein